MEYLGLLGVVGAAVGISVAYFFVKLHRSADGAVFQWFHTAGIFLSLTFAWILCCAITSNFTAPLHWTSFLAGSFVPAANFLAVPAVFLIGLGPSLSIWSCVAIVIQWLIRRFGVPFLATNSNAFLPHHLRYDIKTLNWQLLDIGGVCLVALAAVMFAVSGTIRGGFQQPTSKPAAHKRKGSRRSASPTVGYAMITDLEEEEASNLLLDDSVMDKKKKPQNAAKPSATKEDPLSSPLTSRLLKLPAFLRGVLGVVLSVVLGVFWAAQWLPIEYHINGADHVSMTTICNTLFGYACGAFASSTVLVAVFSALSCNRPAGLVPTSVLPSILSGLIYGSALVAWAWVAFSRMTPHFVSPLVGSCSSLLAGFLGLITFFETCHVFGSFFNLLASLALIAGATSLTIFASKFGDSQSTSSSSWTSDSF